MRNNNKVALTGMLLSGKTTFARYLRDRHGYYLVSFTDQLKEEYAKTFDPPVPLQDILKNKELYRQGLRDFGQEIGYDTGDRVPYWIDRSLQGWMESGSGRVVFDNVRTADQAEYLRSLGFVLVRLTISNDVREARARGLGLDIGPILAGMADNPELEMGAFPVDITLTDTLSWPEAALIVMKGKSNEVRTGLYE